MGRAVWWPPPRRTYLLRPHDGAGTGALAQCRQSSGDVAFRARSFVLRRVYRHAGGSVLRTRRRRRVKTPPVAPPSTPPLLLRRGRNAPATWWPRPEGGWAHRLTRDRPKLLRYLLFTCPTCCRCQSSATGGLDTRFFRHRHCELFNGGRVVFSNSNPNPAVQ